MSNIIRLRVIGDSAGKTSLLLRYCQNEFYNNPMHACILSEFLLKKINIKGNEYKIQLWESYNRIVERVTSHFYYRNVGGIIILYDITNQTSFDWVTNWIQDIQLSAQSDTSIILIGNKCDLKENRVISLEQGQELAKKYNISFFETSTKDNINVEEAFSCLLDQIFSKPEKCIKNTNILLSTEKESSSKCY